MSFPNAIRSCFSQYASFTGRARRSEYWYFSLFTFLLSVVVDVIDLVIKNDALSVVLILAVLLPGLAVAARRLHDTGRTGWWLLIGLIPLAGAIVLLVFAVQDSQGPNQYGASPKEIPVGAGYGY